MPQIDEPTTPAPKAAPEARKLKPSTSPKPPGGVYSFTIDTANGRILTVESVDEAGTRRSLTPDEKAKLAKSHPAMPLRRLVEQAFEAGIEFVLGEGTDSSTPESKEEGELSGMLLQKMIEGSAAGKLVKGDGLHRTVIDTLIIHAAK
jgi:hypothetical protein